MFTRIRLSLSLWLMLLLASRPLESQEPPTLDAKTVNLAIDRGVNFLFSTQDKTTKAWSDIHGQPGGLTALCSLALLNAGVPASDPRLKPALESLLRQGKPSMVYASSLTVMALSAAYPTALDRKVAYANKIREHAVWLEAVQIKEGDRKGGWRYSRETGQGDNSNAQFALLALHEAERTLPDLKINDQTWRLALQYFLEQQTAEGSWGYIKTGRAGGGIFGAPSGSMTCAGISSVIIASGELGESTAQVIEGNVVCCGPRQENSAVERGLAWLGRHFAVDKNPNSPAWQLYFLYGMERVGRLSGRRFFYSASGKPRDWYREGAEQLIFHQRDELTGRFFGRADDEERTPELATALSVLFLAKGRRPVVMAKLQHGERAGHDWDTHPTGVQHLVQHVEALWKKDLSWQTIALPGSTVFDLAESPVLFLSGRESLQLSAEEKRQLKEYIQQGGFLFAEACQGQGCDGGAFDRSFRELMQELFPESSLRLLPPDHPVWYAEEKVDPRHIKPLLGLDTCCRTAVVYCPENLSCWWELRRPRRGVELPAAVQEQVSAAAAMGANVLAYATNRELKEKLDRPRVAIAAAGGEPIKLAALHIPKLAHAGGSDDAPNALRNLGRALEQQAQLRIDARPLLLAVDDPTLRKHPLAFIHGRRAFQLSPAERQALRTYFERGGFVFGDAICAHDEFARSVRQEFAKALPGAQWERIEPDHPLFTQVYRGYELRQVQLRDPLARGGDDKLAARIVSVTPYLEGLKLVDRYVAVFSPYDLSCALENSQSAECKGYLRDDAVRLATNIVLYALGE